MSDVATTPMRDALAWATNDTSKAKEPSTNPFVWLWEAIEGDFNDERSTAQILFDAAVSMIPLVDQLCDMRDLVANVRKLSRDAHDMWNWVALVLTLIGLFPTLGSLVKGVLKIFFAFIRHHGGTAAAKAVDAGMTWVITFLRRRDVQRYISLSKIDEIFKWLATEIRAMRAKVNVRELMRAFDRGIDVLQGLVGKVEIIPVVGKKATATLEDVRRIRMMANEHFAGAIRPVQDLLDSIVLRLEKEALAKQKGIVDVANIHFRGNLPEAAAVALMRKYSPRWLSKNGDEFLYSVKADDFRTIVRNVSAKTDPHGRLIPEKDRFPYLSDQSVESFHTLAQHVIRGPARLYRVLGPSSRAMSDCWVTEAVFKKLQSAPDPKAAWREHLAVWPDWNPDGQFVIYDIKAGETLNVWCGKAASQRKAGLPDHFLRGGEEQIVFNIERTDVRNDTVLYYKNTSGKPLSQVKPMTQEQVNALKQNMTAAQRKAFDDSHLCLRQKINHPNISGPFETGWGYTEFDGVLRAAKIGLPELPGQLTTVNR
ncbi:hypothetical protein [Massilia phyllosphaerae]|uniref:hypothetical protein n=1 Tax=Massilia phyllosphaerae TaxID=3106034 RepID=UPI002B1CB720|nr:hypothetical protein [Massilia sp. SGZ-792]